MKKLILAANIYFIFLLSCGISNEIKNNNKINSINEKLHLGESKIEHKKEENFFLKFSNKEKAVKKSKNLDNENLAKIEKEKKEFIYKCLKYSYIKDEVENLLLPPHKISFFIKNEVLRCHNCKNKFYLKNNNQKDKFFKKLKELNENYTEDYEYNKKTFLCLKCSLYHKTSKFLENMNTANTDIKILSYKDERLNTHQNLFITDFLLFIFRRFSKLKNVDNDTCLQQPYESSKKSFQLLNCLHEVSCDHCNSKMKIHKDRLLYFQENYPELYKINKYDGNESNLIRLARYNKREESFYEKEKNCTKCLLEKKTINLIEKIETYKNL